jgi:hypothetical protein
MRIDFKHFTVPTGINGLHKQTGDARESFADIIYTMVNGIRAHALAMKIYKSDGAEEYTDDEVRLMKGLAERYCTPAFIDGLRAQIQKGGGDESGV